MKYVFILLLSTWAGLGTAQNLQEFYKAAQEAHKTGDIKKFYENITQAHKLHPYHQGILYQCGLAAALNNKPEEAIEYLNKAIQIKADFDLNSQDLRSLAEREDFKKLKALQPTLQTKIINSDTAFVIHDKTLHIECITRGESKGIFYLGSVHKRSIIKRDAQDKVTNFASPAQDGLCSVLGIKIDIKRKILWACSSPMPEMEQHDTLAKSGVFKYDLSGKLITVYRPLSEKKKFVFGDLCIGAKGQVFVSDSENNIIFFVNEKTGKLEEYFSSEEFWNIQGITLSHDETYLFISDYIRGLYRLDLDNKSLKQFTSDFELSLKSIDGLTCYKNSLIGIQNYIEPMRVTQYFLDETKSKLVSYKIIDRGHPAFNEPTIGCLSGNEFYYVANSLWSGYDDQRHIKPEDQLQEVVILKTRLK
jgi:hypothetical protein